MAKEGLPDTAPENKEQGLIVGEVTTLFRYPVKSMRGESVSKISLGYTGFEGDRRYAFIQAESKSSFPWLTARNLPSIVLYTPHFQEEENPKKSPVLVKTPQGSEFLVDSEEMRAELEEKSGRKLTLLHLGRGAYDAMPVSLISDVSVARASEVVGRKLDVRRFRPNIFVTQTLEPLEFDNELVGVEIIIGDREDSPHIALDLKDPRCKIPNIDPETGEVDKKVIKALEEQFGNLLGLYGTVKRPGIIEVGDKVRVIAK